MRPDDERDYLDNTIANGIAVLATGIIAIFSVVYIIIITLT